MTLLIALILLAIVAAGAIGLTPDIVRYMKIRSM
jgi:hypothetical protein